MLGKLSKFIFLSKKFYADYPQKQYPEIEQKEKRPYVQVSVLLDGVQYAIPLRSNINHNFVLWTNKANKCRLDFSKAVVINDPAYIDSKIPHVRQDEFDSLRGKEYIIQTKMGKFIAKYRKAKNFQNYK